MPTNSLTIPPIKNLTISQHKSKGLQNVKKFGITTIPLSSIQLYINKDEVHKILSVIQNKKHYLLIELLWKTGTRITEAISIKKVDIDFFNKKVKIKWLKKHTQLERYIPLENNIAYNLSVYCSSLNNTDKLFNFTRQRAFQIVKEYAEKANIGKKVHPHTLRHSFAIHFLNQNGNIRLLKDLLGHAQITTTMTYLNYTQKDLSNALNNIEF